MMADERGLLQDRYGNGATIVSRRSGGDMLPEKTPFLASEPVRLTPAWEESNLPNDTLNLKGMTMEAATLEVDPPSDSKNLVYLILLLHGIGSLIPWNMFITAKAYFVDYKLAMAPSYANNFMAYVGLCSQVPNLLFNWINIFIEVKSNLTVRIVWSISIVVMLFVGTIILAMVDSSGWPGVFFYLTMLTVILLNAFNAIFQNSVYGMAARLPPRYVGAVVLGSNVAGCLAAVASAITTAVSPGHRTSAVYYFLTALLILLACFDTYFALPLNRYYRYHEMMSAKAAARSPRTSKRPPYWRVFKDASPQLLNIFVIFFVSLSIFPALHSDVKPSDNDFFIPASIYTQVTCFLTFNIMAMIGSSTASMFSWPGPKYLFVLVWARLIFLPLFVLCRYEPLGVFRTMPILISNDWVYWAIAVVFGWSNGHFSSLAMMYIPGCVEKQYAQTAGMYGSAMLITGIVAGIAFSMLGPVVVSLSIFSNT